MKINMAKLRSVSDTKLIQLNIEAAKLLKQNVWPVGKITKSLAQQMYKATNKLLTEYNKNVIKRCDELHKEFESKNLHSNILTKPKTNTKFGISNETTTNNSKQETKTMTKKNSNETTTLNTTEITANIAQLTDVVNKMLARLNALESENVEPKQFKKLRETAEEVKKNVKVAPKKKVIKKANNEQKAEIVKLQKRAQKAKKSLTKKQLAQYTRMWHAKWQEINKKIDINDKAARSLAFAKGRISCLKKARTY